MRGRIAGSRDRVQAGTAETVKARPCERTKPEGTG